MRIQAARAFAVVVIVAAAAGNVPAKTTFTNLVTFDGVDAGGTQLVTLAQGFDGNFYGTTANGGAYGWGVVFQLTPQGTLNDLYSFCPNGMTICPDGAEPYAGLTLGADGNFYGSTMEGGSSANCPAGCGTIFKITPGGTLTTVYSFPATDGAYPYGMAIF